MYFTIFSLAIAVVWVSFFAMLISIFRKQMSVLQYFSIYPLLIVLVFCILRMLLPLELPYTITIESENILPPIQSFLVTPLFDSGYINISLATLLGIIWFSGAVMIAARHARAYCRFRHLLDFLPATEDKRLYQLLAAADKENQPRSIKSLSTEPLNHLQLSAADILLSSFLILTLRMKNCLAFLSTKWHIISISTISSSWLRKSSA